MIIIITMMMMMVMMMIVMIIRLALINMDIENVDFFGVLLPYFQTQPLMITDDN